MKELKMFILWVGGLFICAFSLIMCYEHGIISYTAVGVGFLVAFLSLWILLYVYWNHWLPNAEERKEQKALIDKSKPRLAKYAVECISRTRTHGWLPSSRGWNDYIKKQAGHFFEDRAQGYLVISEGYLIDISDNDIYPDIKIPLSSIISCYRKDLNSPDDIKICLNLRGKEEYICLTMDLSFDSRSLLGVGDALTYLLEQYPLPKASSVTTE